MEVACVALITGLLCFPFRFLRLDCLMILKLTPLEPVLLIWLLISLKNAPRWRLTFTVFASKRYSKGANSFASPDQFWTIIGSLFFTTLLKIILTIVTFGIKVPAGVFIPSMAVGACVGRILGMMMQVWQETFPGMWLFASCEVGVQCVTPGTYAMVGAAAALAGVTRMTVSLAVIMFELTGALSYVLPIMITVMVANWIGNGFGKCGIYDGLIQLNGYPFLDTKEEYDHNANASMVMTPVADIQVISATSHTVDTLGKPLRFMY